MTGLTLNVTLLFNIRDIDIVEKWQISLKIIDTAQLTFSVY